MMSTVDIRDYQREAAGKAAKEGRRPLMIWPEDVGNIDTLRNIPLLGDHVPDGWTEVLDDEGYPVRHFVDASGFGARDEPALTIEEFAAKLKPGTAYGITQVGQFQIYITAFDKAQSHE